MFSVFVASWRRQGPEPSGTCPIFRCEARFLSPPGTVGGHQALEGRGTKRMSLGNVQAPSADMGAQFFFADVIDVIRRFEPRSTRACFDYAPEAVYCLRAVRFHGFTKIVRRLCHGRVWRCPVPAGAARDPFTVQEWLVGRPSHPRQGCLPGSRISPRRMKRVPVVKPLSAALRTPHCTGVLGSATPTVKARRLMVMRARRS